MNKIKMSLYFKLPATGLIRSLSCNACIDSNCDGVGEYEAAELAISSYDASQDLITKQAEQIKMLRSVIEIAINKIDILDKDAMGIGHMHGVAPWSIRDEQLYNLSKALEATKPVEE